MPTTYTEELPVTMTAYRSAIDGRVVVQIDQDTDAASNEIRVFLNDGAIFDGDSETTVALDPTEGQRLADRLDDSWDHGDLSAVVRDLTKFLRGIS